jgi:hypothetical protein
MISDDELRPDGDRLDGDKENNSLEVTEPPKDYPLKGIPNLDFYRRTYARSCGENDQKAVRICKEFESPDRVRKIKTELASISQGNCSPELLERIMGKSRAIRSGSWEKWAFMMIAGFNSKR